MRARTVTAVLLAAAALLCVPACGGGGGGDDASSSSTKPTTATTTPALPASFDWWSPQTTALGHGWTIGPCAPAQQVPKSQGRVDCLNNADGRQAVVEHYRFNAPADRDMDHHAAQFMQDFTADRKAGCGAGYRVVAEPVVPLTLPDGDAREYGFHGGFAGAPDTERTIQWAGIRGDVLVIVTISAYDPGSCVPNSGQGSVDDLKVLVPAVDRLVRGFGLPPLNP
jgi:hypothetical protein